MHKPRKDCVAMLLAGGQGSRLQTLTEKIAKPALPFGGKYRIIDFVLSNCSNSGIDTVGVLTQYQPLELNEYIGSGQTWDLDRANGGVTVLPPYRSQHSADWYCGTANAIYQNLHFLERFEPTDVLVLSGDHIYKMDYSRMLAYHRQHRAVCTIAVIQVPLQEAHRFGILTTDSSGAILGFEEKPEHPSATTASMGVYIFDRLKLTEYLTQDAADPQSSKDFGKNIIPAMLAAGERLYAYRFDGYWKDVGTIDSLWDANMDLLGERPALELQGDTWRIYSHNDALPPHYIGVGARVVNSIVPEGCEIYGSVEHSVLFPSVHVAHGAVIRDAVIGSGTEIGEGAVIERALIDENTRIGAGVHIGGNSAAQNTAEKENQPITVIGSDLFVRAGTTIPSGAMVNAEILRQITTAVFSPSEQNAAPPPAPERPSGSRNPQHRTTEKSMDKEVLS